MYMYDASYLEVSRRHGFQAVLGAYTYIYINIYLYIYISIYLSIYL